MEINYNEGWNVYNAGLLANHQLLYPVRYGWTSVNYPMLWFVILANLHRYTHDYLFTARALSLVGLIGCCVLIGASAHVLGASRQASCLASLFCLAVFVSEADEYIGMADPQIFAQMIFLAGLYTYLVRRKDFAGLTLAAFLFVVGGSIKHNPIEIPLAVLLDLLILAPWRALWFGVCGLLFASVAIWLNIHYGGPFFVAQMLAPREYSLHKAWTYGAYFLVPLLLPLGAAIYMAVALRKDEVRRIGGILLASSLAIGLYFIGGSGVWVNALFSVFLAVSLLMGIAFDKRLMAKILGTKGDSIRLIALSFFLWLLIPWFLFSNRETGDWNPLDRLHRAGRDQASFAHEVIVLRNLKGPVLCESLLLCAFAEKPYIYDPFNATRLIHLHKLDPAPILTKIENEDFAAVQLDKPIQEYGSSERFDLAIIKAIDKAYSQGFSSDLGTIYYPRPHSN